MQSKSVVHREDNTLNQCLASKIPILEVGRNNHEQNDHINGNQSVTVVSSDSSNSYTSKNDAEMDKQAKAAARSAIYRVEICKSPLQSMTGRMEKHI